MVKPLSMDLRERAMARVAAGEPIRVIAAALGVGASSVSKWSTRLKATGTVAPGKMGGHVPLKLAGAHAQWLRERMAGADFTLRGLKAELAERNVSVDYKTVWKFVHREKLTFKKKAFCQPNRTALMWRANGPAGRRGKVQSISDALFSLMKHGPRPIWPRGAAGLCAASG